MAGWEPSNPLRGYSYVQRFVVTTARPNRGHDVLKSVGYNTTVLQHNKACQSDGVIAIDTEHGFTASQLQQSRRDNLWVKWHHRDPPAKDSEVRSCVEVEVAVLGSRP